MKEPGFQRSIDAFAHAYALEDEAQLEAYLQRLERESPALRQEVESLLAERSRSREPDSSGGSERTRPGDAPRTSYPTIPGCVVTGEIGSGGFGTVYRARRDAVELAPVAIKVLRDDRHSRTTLERFLRERELHARTDSRYVAQVYDVGTTAEGEPYLMMELVEGSQTCLEFAEEQALSIPERLELFQAICEGVEHLHRNGVVHRDLKPSNVLVSIADDEPCPKLIDFGLAKPTDGDDGLTGEDVRIGTLRYMSPEQSTGESVDARTDVFSLGVLLHELLTGLRPDLVEGPSDEVRPPSSRVSTADSVVDTAVRRRLRTSRQLVRALRGDLDAILLRCLRYDPAERYQTVHALRADVARHARGEPVLARGEGALYTLARLARRHPVATGAVAVGASALVAGVWIALAALGAERTANAALARSNQDLELVLDYERDRIAAIDAAAIGPALRAELLAQAELGLQQLDTPDAAERLAAFRTTLENTNFTSVGLEALEHGVFRGAQASIDAAFSDRPRLRAQLSLELAENLRSAGLLDLASEPAETALALHEAEFGASAPETLAAASSLGTLQRLRGDLDAAEASARRVVAAARERFGPDDPRTLRYALGLAHVELSRLDGSSAAESLRALRGPFQEAFGADGLETVQLESYLATALVQSGLPVEGVEAARAALDALDDHPGADAGVLLEALYNLGFALLQSRDVDAARDVVHLAYGGYADAHGLEHPDTLKAGTLLAQLQIFDGELEAATELLRTSLDAHERLYGTDNVDTVRATANLSQVLRRGGRFEDAATLGERGVERARRLLSGDSVLLGEMLVDFGRTLGLCGRLSEAAEHMHEGYDVVAAQLGAGNPKSLQAADALSALYEVWHDAEPGLGHDRSQAEWAARSAGDFAGTQRPGTAPPGEGR